MENILEIRDKVLKVLSGKLEGFYLVGGTALSVFYFSHRESYDLDLFSKEFSKEKVESIVAYIHNNTSLAVKLIAEQDKKDRAKILVYSLRIDSDSSLKIDFVEDVYRQISPLKIVDGIPVLSKEDIYLRKIFAIGGSYEAEDAAGKKVFKGGRQEAKDFFDLYFLSATFIPLSKFAVQYCPPPQIESIIVWHRTYDRMRMKLGILEDIMTNKKVDYREMEHHFKSEIEELIKIGF